MPQTHPQHLLRESLANFHSIELDGIGFRDHCGGVKQPQGSPVDIQSHRVCQCVTNEQKWIYIYIYNIVEYTIKQNNKENTT